MLFCTEASISGFCFKHYREISKVRQVSLCLRFREKVFYNGDIVLFRRTQCEEGVELRKGEGTLFNFRIEKTIEKICSPRKCWFALTLWFSVTLLL